MDKKMVFELSPKQLKYKDILDKDFLELEIYAISDVNPNRNQSHFTLESMQKSLASIRNKPILAFFDKGDFVEHNGVERYDPETDTYYWDTSMRGERILGLVRESDTVDIVEKDGLHWIRLTCALWTQYCYKEVRRLLRDKTKKVSVEITVKDFEVKNGIEEIYEFNLLGITILGSKNGRPIPEAIPGAHLTVFEKWEEDEGFEKQRQALCFAYKEMQERLSKDEIGTKPNIKVNKSKEAISDKPWGDVDKTALRNRVVAAGNFKTVAKDIFLQLEDGWENGETSKLKYPVMEVDGNTAVYNRGGLASALGYATKNNESAVLSKVKAIYEKLGLNEESYSEWGQENMSQTDYESFLRDNKTEGEQVMETHSVEDLEKKEVCGGEGEECAPECPPQADEHCDEFNDCEGEPECKPEGEGHEPEECEEKEDCAANTYSKEEYNELECKYSEACAELEKCKAACDEYSAKCEGLQAECDNYSTKIKEMEQKYTEACAKLAEAEGKLFTIHCGELKCKMAELMNGEDIIDEDRKSIEMKCDKGEYACDEDLAKDVAYAVFKARAQFKEKMSAFSMPIANQSAKIETDNKPMTRADRLAKYAAGKN